jgi:hypothetical protein
MRKILLMLPLLAALFVLLPGCSQRDDNAYDDNAYDEHFIPYGIIDFDVYVYNTNTDKEYYVGRVATDYPNAQARLSDAQSLVYYFVESHHLKDWSYICCTVTKTSRCATKVK